jgi:outer membrane protein assembly factor BamB
VSDWTWDAPFAVPAMIVADASGRLYAAFDGLATAVDPSSHAIAWERHGPSAVLASLGSGVLALQGDGLVALAADGAERWRRPIPPGEHVFPAGVAYDAARGRVYVERSSGAAPGVTALDAATGAQLWRTTTADRARLLSVGRGGRVYLAIDRPGHLAVRGVRLTGATAWQRNARRRISDALELRNGTIAVSVDKRFGGPEATSLTLLDPR